MTRRTLIVLATILLAGISLWALNSSRFASREGRTVEILAHRGLAQTFPAEGLGRDTCTASRIDPPEHPYLENTIESMRAAFDYGASVVELDVHPTTDGELAVFHDWMLDCRTNGTGVTREQSMSYLKTLDVGWGYTADGGETFPFRGKFVGAMPTFDEVLETFPDRRFLINIKSNDPAEGDRLADVLETLPEPRREQMMIYGGALPIEVIRARVPAVRAMSRQSLKSCLVRYIAFGWSGHVPEACHGTLVMVPANVAPWLWGWPNRFLNRMESAGSSVYLVNDYPGHGVSEGLDTIEDLREKVPEDYTGGIWTDRADLIAPALGIRNRSDQ